MTPEGLATTAAALMLGANAWFVRRLIISLDTFKQEMRTRIGEHGEQLAAIDERHRLEDGGMNLHLHRRVTDA